MDLDLTNPESLPPLLAIVVKGLLQRTLDAKVGHAVCHAADTALRAFALGPLKKQMDKVASLLALKATRPVDPAEIQNLIRFEKDEMAQTIEQLEGINLKGLKHGAGKPDDAE
jgi:hypothetical protein